MYDLKSLVEYTNQAIESNDSVVDLIDEWQRISTSKELDNTIGPDEQKTAAAKKTATEMNTIFKTDTTDTKGIK